MQIIRPLNHRQASSRCAAGGGGAGPSAVTNSAAAIGSPEHTIDRTAPPLVITRENNTISTSLNSVAINTRTPSNNLYLLINTPDPASASEQVVNYLAQNKIAFDEVPADAATTPPVLVDREVNRTNVALPPPSEVAKDSTPPTTSPSSILADAALENAKALSTQPAERPQPQNAQFNAQQTAGKWFREDDAHRGRDSARIFHKLTLRQQAMISPSQYAPTQNVDVSQQQIAGMQKEQIKQSQQNGQSETSAQSTTDRDELARRVRCPEDAKWSVVPRRPYDNDDDRHNPADFGVTRSDNVADDQPRRR